jgi:S-adenosylmethionine-diacylglycerol 3-amino-3-carboxypropyl transferase
MPRSWAQSVLFDHVYRNHLIYNQCWEDPAVDRQALQLSPSDRVLVITSAGCNALDYALLGAKVLAVDANPRQNYLLELKLAGIRSLDYESFFTLFGLGGGKEFAGLYRIMRPELSGRAQVFWDREIRLFDPERVGGRSFYYTGTSGLVALLVKGYIDHVVRARKAVDRIMSASSLAEQLERYRSELREPLLRKSLLEFVGSRGVLSLLGVPAPQRQMVHELSGGFVGFMRDCMDHVMSVALLRDNYFWSVYATGRYSRESCPEYLKTQNFAALKAGLVENVRTVTGTVTECLRSEHERLTAFVLLDHMDWLVGAPNLLEEEWREILAAAAPGARAIFRSGGPDASFLPPRVSERLRFDTERAATLHRQDRVGTYTSFHIAQLDAAA